MVKYRTKSDANLWRNIQRPIVFCRKISLGFYRFLRFYAGVEVVNILIEVIIREANQNLAKFLMILTQSSYKTLTRFLK